MFEAVVVITGNKIKTRFRDGFGRIPFYYNGKRKLKVLYIKRLDSYTGICKDLAIS